LFEAAISEDLSFDISGNINQRDGYFDNLFDGSEWNERDRWGLRGQLYWTPNDTTAIRIIADYDEIDELCCGTTNIVSGPTGGAVTALGGRLVPNDPFSRQGQYDTVGFNTLENKGLSGHIEKDYGNFTLSSITAFRTSDTVEDVDIDYTSLEVTSSGRNEIEIDTFTQELRLTSNGDGDVDWMVGGFYFDESIDYYSEVLWGKDTRNFFDILSGNSLAGIEGFSGFPVGQTFFTNGSGVRDNLTQDNQALSLFSTVDWHISDSLVGTLGLSYTQDEKDVTLKQQNTASFSQFPSATLDAGGLRALQTFTDPQEFPNAIEDGTSDDDDVTYTIRLAYDLNDNVNVYVNHGTGFKATSWNLSRDSRPSPTSLTALRAAGLASANLTSGSRFAGPEEATVYELGLKARYDRFSINSAIFEQSIKGFQSAIFVGTGFVLSNAGEQTTKGVEFDLNYYPADALKLTLAGTFLDPKYDSFVGARGPDGPTDLSGKKVAGVHEVSLVASATYNFQLGNNDAYVRGDYQFEDEVQVVENITAEIASREVKLLNLAAGMSTESGLDFNIWMRNVLDEDFLLSAFPTPVQAGSFNGYANEPRTYGVSVKKNF
jgi:iron complex outermembrane receptor protein